MDRICLSFFLAACIAGQLVWTADTNTNGTALKIAPPEPPITTPAPNTTTPSPTTVSTTTTHKPTSPSPTEPPTTPLPTSKPTSPKPTSPIPTSTKTPPTTDPTPIPTASTTTHKPAPIPPPSDRKFDAFSFIGGFALAIGLVAIGFLVWKLYISRRENVYHTL